MDHDYTLAAMKRCNESGKEFWSGVVTMIRSAEPLIVEPIRSFTQGDLKNFKVGHFSFAISDLICII